MTEMPTPVPDDLLARVFAAIDARAEEIVQFAGEFIRQPSINPDLEPNIDAELPAQTWLRDRLQVMGGFDSVEMWEIASNRPNVVAKRIGSGGGRSLMWAAHTDVVPVSAEQREQWRGDDPFSGHVEDGWLWGRGASDMKGAIAAYVMAATILADEGITLQGDLTLAQACGEESGRRDIGCNTILERGYGADIAIFPEPSNFSIYPTVKGELYFRLTVPGKSTHICNRHLVAQPVPYGFERPGVSAIDNMLKYQLAILELEKQWGLWRSNEHVPPGGMFVSINTMQAGGSITSIPDSADATGSLLFNPDLTGDEVVAEVRAAIQRVTDGDAWLREHPPVLDIPLDASSAAPWIKEPVNLAHDHPLIEVIQTAMGASGRERVPVTISPFVCDANFWFPLGQDCLIWGIGEPSWGIHGTNERIPVADLIAGTKAFAAATMAWCGVD
ncbi:MAG TPA: M20/M25/M40 family metallo-hydrolase [Thermomicrobiales bacterium]|nr:M20/M25/M40 family metallo-hydrolase [Thermomicrobiales bacterium]